MTRVAADGGDRTAEGTDGAGDRQLLLLEPCDRLRRKDAARGASVYADVLRAVILEQLPVHRGDILTGRGKGEFRRHAVSDGHHLDASESGDRNRLRAGTVPLPPDEAAAVQIDEHAVAIAGFDAGLRGNQLSPHTAEHLLLDGDRIEDLA